MGKVITVGVIIATWAFAENIPAPLITPLAIISLVAIFTGLTVAAVKWVQNA
jgi:hypothetical protein